MPDPYPAPYHLRQLASLCTKYPLQPKVVFLPKQQLGRAVLFALGKSGVRWVNLHTSTPLDHAREATAPVIARDQKRLLSKAAALFVTASSLTQPIDLKPDPIPLASIGPGLVRTFASTFQELRLAGVTPDELYHATGSARMQALAERYRHYLDLLEEDGLVDEAGVLEVAIDSLRNIEDRQDRTIYAVFDDVELTPLAFEYLRQLTRTGSAFYRIGCDAPGIAPPPRSAAALFPEAPYPESEIEIGAGGYLFDPDSLPQERQVNLHFVRSIGVENEFRAALRHILDNELPLDAVEIAYTENRPYLTLIHSTAERLGLPVTLSAGLPLTHTRVGQAVRFFLYWIEHRLAPDDLIRMLRGGLVRLDRLPFAHDLNPQQAATLLAGLPIGEGKEAYFKALAFLQTDLENALQRQSGDLAKSTETRLNQIVQLQRILQRLFDQVPDGASVSLRDLATGAATFLVLFGPVDEPKEKKYEREAYTNDEFVFQQLRGQFAALADLRYSDKPEQLARMLRELIEGEFIRASAPAPGCLHVGPLEGAGLSGRPHLFVLGLDESTAVPAGVENPLLLDAERLSLKKSGIDLPLRRDVMELPAWHLVQSLARVMGRVVLVANRLDLLDNRELAPSSLFLRAARLRGFENVENALSAIPICGFLPGDEPDWLLDDLEMWLTARHDPSMAAKLDEDYKWCRKGLLAATFRAEEPFTTFDGRISDSACPELDPFTAGGRVSPSRLELLAACPFAYFLKYVLRLQPPDEDVREEGEWLDRAGEGNVLHEVFRRFMSRLKETGQKPREEHRDLLENTVDEVLAELTDRFPPPNPAIAYNVERRVREGARIFLAAEIDGNTDAEPFAFELGFGLEEHEVRLSPDGERLPDQNVGPLTIPLKGTAIRCRGWVDRVDRRPDGSLVVWDYKTGRNRFDADNPLQEGRSLQWAIYAYAVEELLKRPVSQAGYFFTSAREVGDRLILTPPPREQVADLLETLARYARAGCFPQSDKKDDCSYCDYKAVCGELPQRKEKKRNAAEIIESVLNHPNPPSQTEASWM